MREISSERIERVEQLLREGHSQREVARRTGVSRSTVNRVATHRRPDYEALRRESEEELQERCGPVLRCKGCGYLVEMPCLVCEARAVRERTLRERRRLLGAGGTRL